MNKLTAEVARQDLSHLKAWLETCGISMKEERYMQALEIALPILEQQERGEGEWIDWRGGKQPIADGREVAIKFRDGTVMAETLSDCWVWSHGGDDDDIIAYRIIPEQPTNQNGEQ